MYVLSDLFVNGLGGLGRFRRGSRGWIEGSDRRFVGCRGWKEVSRDSLLLLRGLAFRLPGS